MKKLNVLIVDDSAYMRKRLSEIFLKDSRFDQIRTANGGREALKKLSKDKPDVVTLDLEMPDLDGIHTLDYIMSDFPVPVVIVSAHSEKGSKRTFEALRHGAVDVVTKPSGEISLNIEKVEEELINKVIQASKVKVEKFMPKIPEPQATFRKLVIIGASTGGPPALEIVLSQLPAGLDACVLVVQHMPAGFTNSFANRLSRICKLPVHEAIAKETLAGGKVFVAPGGFHMELVTAETEGSPEARIDLTTGPAFFGIRPAVDNTMETAVSLYGANIIGVLLTGMGSDGTIGMSKIKEAGGMTIAQDKQTSAVFGMPKSAIDAGVVDKVLPLSEIAGEIVEMVKK